MIETNWYIITGGPSAGKSTTLNGIAFRGYKTIPEIARVLIDEEKSKGKAIKEIRDNELLFQETVLKMKMDFEKLANPTEITFFDRGVLDSIPFMKVAGANKERLTRVRGEYLYKSVFFLEQLSFNSDYARIETPKQAMQLSKLLFEIYSERGFEVIRVPNLPVSQRVDYILNHIEYGKNN